MMTDIYDWRAVRFGSSITVTGRLLDGTPVKAVQVAFIEPSPTAGTGAVATLKGGKRVWLRDRNALETPTGWEQK